MARVVREDSETVVRREPVVETTAVQPAAVVPVQPRAIQIIYLILSIIEVLLALRLILRLLGANSAHPLVSLIYNLTYPLILPFSGIFSLPADLGVAGFELATLIAMVAYALIAYLIIAAVRVSLTRSRL